MRIAPELGDTVLRPLTALVTLSILLTLPACSTAESKNASPADVKASAPAPAAPSGPTIEIEQGGPADTVQVFYRHLRDKKFREAIFLTNLRPAIEGLTDTELKDFAVDFEAIAGDVPAELNINGEIVTGDRATVTVNLPSAKGEKPELQTINLRRENGIWVIVSVDDVTEARIKKDGKRYFYNLRIETHEEEARKMLERISKAQLAHSLQNGGLHAEMQTLIDAGLLAEDVKTSETTGYNYAITLAGDKKSYTATATPSEYGKSGKLSFLLQLDGKGISRVTGKDTGGTPLKK